MLVFLRGLFLWFSDIRDLPTECEVKRDDALNFRSDRELPLPVNREVWQCRPEGGYDYTQCSADRNECWCVYHNVMEIRGTRTNGKPSCGPEGEPVGPCLVLVMDRLHRLVVLRS